MKIRVLYFASIRESLGRGEEQIDTQAQTLGQLRDQLIAQGGAYTRALGREQAVRMAFNQTVADESAALADGAEIAFFPPVTGG